MPSAPELRADALAANVSKTSFSGSPPARFQLPRLRLANPLTGNSPPKSPSRTGRLGLRAQLPGLGTLSVRRMNRGNDGRVFNEDRIEKLANGGSLFHGAPSASLLTFFHPDPALRGKLMSMKELRANNLVPFSGECGNTLSSRARDAVSSVDLPHFCEAYNYAGSTSGTQDADAAVGFNPQSSNNKLKELMEILSHDDGHNELFETARAQVKLIHEQRARYQELPVSQQRLVSDGFAVVYAISRDVEQDTARTKAGGSDIAGEHFIEGGVNASEITALFVERSRVNEVKNIVDQAGARHIKVASFDDISVSL
ncbi:MAG TPA: hypothetical protein VFS42_01420 [Burkholderiaceae bacterium]|nr:hypothetical protein [Burkholderiaceae bacterium]